jgi:hypothetical protein
MWNKLKFFFELALVLESGLFGLDRLVFLKNKHWFKPVTVFPSKLEPKT